MSEVIDKVVALLGDAVIDSHDHCGDDTVLVEADSVVESLQALRDDTDLRFNFLMDLTAVDYLDRDPRFEVVYHLASIDTEPRGTEPSRLRQRLRVKAGVAEVSCEIGTVSGVWPAADWMEREVFDMYGVRFKGHPRLERILLYEEFQGYPLRKDYPKERRQPLVGPRN